MNTCTLTYPGGGIESPWELGGSFWGVTREEMEEKEWEERGSEEEPAPLP